MLMVSLIVAKKKNIYTYVGMTNYKQGNIHVYERHFPKRTISYHSVYTLL